MSRLNLEINQPNGASTSATPIWYEMRHSKGPIGRRRLQGRPAKYVCNVDAIMRSTNRKKEGEKGPQRDLLTCVTTQCGTESSFCLDVCGASLMMIFLAFTAIFSLMADAASENCSRKGNEVVRSMHAPGCFIEAISSSRASRGLSSGASWRRVKVFRPDRSRAERERERGKVNTYNKAKANGTT